MQSEPSSTKLNETRGLILEIFLFFFIITSRYWLLAIIDPTYEQNLVIIVSEILVIVISLIVAFFVNYIRLNSLTDIRFRIIAYVAPVVTAAVMSGITLGSVEEELIITIIIVQVVPLFLLVIVFMNNIFTYMKKFKLPFEQVIRDFDNGNLGKEIDDEVILSDYIFSDLAELTNQIIRILANNLQESIEASNILVSSSEELSEATNQFSKELESVRFSIEHLLKGTTEQATRTQDVRETFNSVFDDVLTISQSIREYTTEVDSITQETKYLALNARIEASRAGAAGRGFSVVAEDVRSLSDQTNKVSDQIREITQQITENMTSNFQHSLTDITQVANISEETAATVEEVTASINMIAESIAIIRQTANTLSNQSISLNSTIQQFK